MQEAKHVCSVKLSDVYEKLGVEQKLDGDITDPSCWEAQKTATKFVLGEPVKAAGLIADYSQRF